MLTSVTHAAVLASLERLTLDVISARLGSHKGAPALNIQTEISTYTHRRIIPISHVSLALRRLEQLRLCFGEMSDPKPHRGGKSRRLYRINKAGCEELQRIREAIGG